MFTQTIFAFNLVKNYLIGSDPFFSHSSSKVLSINSFVSGNALLTAYNRDKAILSHFLSILIMRVFFEKCFQFFEKCFQLLYIHSWHIMVVKRWLVFKISKCWCASLWLVFKIFKHCPRAFVFMRGKWFCWQLQISKDLYKLFITYNLQMIKHLFFSSKNGFS